MVLIWINNLFTKILKPYISTKPGIFIPGFVFYAKFMISLCFILYFNFQFFCWGDDLFLFPIAFAIYC